MKALFLALLLFPTTVAAQSQTGATIPLTMVDGSSTIAVAGTSQQVFAANFGRKYLMCQNPIAAVEPLLINLGALATSGVSYELAPGGSILFSVGVPVGTINVSAVTAGHGFVCKQGFFAQ